MTRQLGVAHLTLLPLTPPEMIDVAAATGLDFVGIRVHAVTPTEQLPDLRPGSPMLRETLARLDGTGVVVRDIEFLPLTSESGPDDWKSSLEAGARLGASVFTVAGADTDRSRLIDTLARLAADAAEFGIRPALEPISYQSVSTVAEAASLARAAGAALMLDPLHIQRGGSSLDDVAALEPTLVPVLQLCDAPLALADDGPDRTAARQHEARKDRMVVGEGELPLAGLLAATPPGVPVSLEIPNVHLQATLPPREFLAVLARAARTLIAQADGAREEGRTDA